MLFGKFKGIDNKHDMTGLESLKSGTNIDIDANSRIRMRNGHSLTYAGNVTSLWASKNNCMFSENGFLYKLESDLSTVTQLGAIGKDVAYREVDGKVYIMDGNFSYVYDGSLRKWGIDSPPAPSLTVSGGSMPLGKYRVSITEVVDGRESGSSPFSSVMAGGSIVVSVPNRHIRIYATSANGDQLFRIGETHGKTSFTYGGQISATPLKSRYSTPPESGHMICYHKGRIYVAVGSVLYYSNPLDYERFDLAFNYIQMSGQITMLESVEEGLYIADGNIHFLQGNEPDKFIKKIVAPYNAIPGTATEIDLKYAGESGTGIVVTTEMGICICSGKATRQGGTKFTNLTEDSYAMIHGETGIGTIRRQGGMVQYLSLVNGDSGNPVNIF